MSPFFFINARLSHKLMSTDEFEALINKMPDIIKRYRTVEASDKYKEFRALEMTVSTDFFRSQKDKILEQKNGKKLWAESEEGKQEARLAELKKDDDILFLQSTDEKQIRQAEALRPVVKDNFNWKQLSDSPWSPGFLYPSKDFVAVHSYVNELQAYTGGKNVRRLLPFAVEVFVAPPSLQELRRRLEKRGTETPQAIETRMKIATRELACAKDYDYIVINDVLEDAVQDVLAIIRTSKLKKENMLNKLSEVTDYAES